MRFVEAPSEIVGGPRRSCLDPRRSQELLGGLQEVLGSPGGPGKSQEAIGSRNFLMEFPENPMNFKNRNKEKQETFRNSMNLILGRLSLLVEFRKILGKS